MPFWNRQQCTLCRPVAVEGFGFWSGEEVQVEMRPASPGEGVTFVRCDLSPHRRIPVCAGTHIDTPRRTTLTAGGAKVAMVEHILAALAGLRVDNCEIWVTAAEMPGCDGSSLDIVNAINSVGIIPQEVPQPCLVIEKDVHVGDEDHFVAATPGMGSRLVVEYDLDYPHAHVGRQRYKTVITPETFQTNLAAARTFVTDKEAHKLQARGFAQQVTAQDLLVFGDDGLIDNQLRFDDECVRHKVLDIVGDLSLVGCDIQGHIRAFRSGHRLNVELVKCLLEQCHINGNWRLSA